MSFLFSNSRKALMSLLLLALPQEPLASIPHVWNVPTENHNFIGREGLLKDIATIFKNAPLKTVVLYGPSGIGKSQIAKKYAYQNYTAYDVVWWFQGNQYLESQFEEFALEIGAFLNLNIDHKIKTFGHNKLINLIKSAIRRKNLKCLIIFDNAQVYHDIESYIPFSHDKSVHIIVTTENANFSNNDFQVKPFQRKESVLCIHRFLSSESKEYQNKLAKRLGDYPILIASAIDYVNDYPGMTIENYLQQYNVETSSSPRLLKNAAEKLGGSLDGYPMDLAGAVTMNLKKLKRNSHEALTLVGFLSLLNPGEIDLSDIKTWLNIRKINTDPLELFNHLKRYSFIDVTTLKNKNKKKVYISMHNLRQKIINATIPIDEKKKLIDECVYVLKKAFSGRSDKVVENILKATTPLSHAVKLSDEAAKIDYHSDALTELRIKVFDTLLCGFRDLKQANIMNAHLQKDLNNGIHLSRKNKILYHINRSVFSGMHDLDYEKALAYGAQAATLLEKEDKMYEEKIRLIANMIQYFALIGNLDQCEDLLKQGEHLLPLSQSAAYNALFIFATAMSLIDKGDFQKAIDLIVKHNSLLKKLDFYSSIRFFILNQLAEAFLKQGKTEECREVLEHSEKEGLEFYDNTKNTFFAHLYVLRAGCDFLKRHKFNESESYLLHSLEIYNEIVSGKKNCRKEAFAHLMLGKLYHLNAKHSQAKKHYLLSEQIFEKTLKNKRINDVSELYKMLATLGMDTQDEFLIHTYSKKQLDTFGPNHPKTIEISTHLDQKKVLVPF